MSQLENNPIATVEGLRIECVIEKQCVLRLSVHKGQVSAIFTDEDDRCYTVKKDPLTLGPLVDYLVDNDRERNYKEKGGSEADSFLWCVWDRGLLHVIPYNYRSEIDGVALSEADLVRMTLFFKKTFEAARQEQREACRLNQPTFGLA